MDTELTMLELMDLLNDIMMENDLQDLPVYFASSQGLIALREDLVGTEPMADMDGEPYVGIVIG